MTFFYTITSVAIVSLASLTGIFLLTLGSSKIKKYLFILVSLSVGALFGDVFIHLLPEIINTKTNLSFVLLGLILFFVLEKFFLWRHEHCSETDCHLHPIAPVGYMNLISDGIHNFIDGALIAASYLADIQLGIATTLAIMLHEIPQEIGDFGILLHAGFSSKKALLFNLLSALMAIAGAIITFLLGTNLVTWILPVTAGGFIYIAGSDLVPELHKTSKIKQSILQFFTILLGVVLMWILTIFG